jgi:predicted DsbA family dithiol-disulfide isomerase
MLDRQFEMQKQGGLSVDELKNIAHEIGVDANRVEREIAAGTHTDRVMATMTQIRQIGMTGVPAVMLNGRVIASSSRNAPCFAQLIETLLP